MSKNNEEKKYNPTLAMFYEMKNGFWSLPLNAKDYDSIMNEVHQGGRLVFKMNKFRKDDKSPHAYLEIIPKEKVDEMERQYQERKGNKNSGNNDEI